MSSLATRRLIDAAATLDPADRALLNLWVNRGLSEERLIALTGMSEDAMAARRQRIIGQLAAELGLPEQDVRAALTHISPGRDGLPAATNGAGPANGTAPANGTVPPNGAAPANGTAPAHAAQTVDEVQAPTNGRVEPPAEMAGDAPAETAEAAEVADAPAETTETAAGEESPAGRGPGLWLGLLAAAVVVALVVVIVIVASSSSSKPAARSSSTTASTPAAAAPTTAAPTTAATGTTPAAPTTTPPTGGAVPAPLAGLPGGLLHASGSVKLSGPVKHLKLNLRVSGVPAAHNGHYEVWLYNSVLDSRPLGRLRAGHPSLTVRLPGNARHYRWIDVSFQPVGVVDHSGESELRASNPAHTTKARLRGHAARTRHALRQPAKVGVNAGTGGTSAAAAKRKQAARLRQAHRRRTAKGSKNDTTSK